MGNKKIKPKEPTSQERIYLKGVKKADADWFRKESKRLGYSLKEFFETIVEGYRK